MVGCSKDDGKTGVKKSGEKKTLKVKTDKKKPIKKKKKASGMKKK
jgi:hypothetical protein